MPSPTTSGWGAVYRPERQLCQLDSGCGTSRLLVDGGGQVFYGDEMPAQLLGKMVDVSDDELSLIHISEPTRPY